MIPTSVHAALFHNEIRIGKVRNIEFETSRETLENTTLDIWDRSFIYGLRNSTASASLFYDPDNTVAVNLIQSIYTDNSTPTPMVMVFDSRQDRSISASVLLTNISVSSSFGEAQVCNIQFQITRKPTPEL